MVEELEKLVFFVQRRAGKQDDLRSVGELREDELHVLDEVGARLPLRLLDDEGLQLSEADAAPPDMIDHPFRCSRDDRGALLQASLLLARVLDLPEGHERGGVPHDAGKAGVCPRHLGHLLRTGGQDDRPRGEPRPAQPEDEGKHEANRHSRADGRLHGRVLAPQ